MVDAYSKYLDVIPMAHATSATTISALHHLFSVFGLPEHLVTDNDSQFTSAEFQKFLDSNGISTQRRRQVIRQLMASPNATVVSSSRR